MRRAFLTLSSWHSNDRIMSEPGAGSALVAAVGDIDFIVSWTMRSENCLSWSRSSEFDMSKPDFSATSRLMSRPISPWPD